MLYAGVFIPTCAPNVLIYFCFGGAEVSSNCARPAGRRQGVSRVIYLTLPVMYSHYPRDSVGFLLSFIRTFFTITVTPSLFSFHISSHISSLFPPPSQPPWRFIVALTERPLRLSLNTGRDVYHGSAGSDTTLGPVCVRACISKPDVYETEDLPLFSARLSSGKASQKSGI